MVAVCKRWGALWWLCCSLACTASSEETAMRNSVQRASTVQVAAAVEVTGDAIDPVGPAQSGALALGRRGERLWAFIADADERAVVVVDVDAERELFRHELDGQPEHVLVAGDRIFVSVASEARVEQLVVRDHTLVRRASVEVAAEPTGMALTLAGELLVASRWGATLTVLDADTLATRRRVALPRDPYAVVVMGNAREALVTHVVGGKLSVVDLDSGAARQLEAGRVDHKEASSMMMMPMGPGEGSRFRGDTVRADRKAVQAFAASRDGEGRIHVSASLADGSRSPTGSGYGGGTTSIRTHAGVELLVAPDAAEVTVPQGTARDVGNDCFLPRASAFDHEHELLLVACAGTHRVLHLETQGYAAGVPRIEHRVPAGPAGIAIDAEGGRWVAWSQFAGALSTAPLTGRAGVVEVVPIERRHPLPAAVARGRELFHQAGAKRVISADGRACASCHPSGRDDAMTWSTLEGPRQTPILMGRITDTAPFGWNGRMADVHQHLERTLERLGGIGIDAAQRHDLVAYIEHMQPPRQSADDGALVQRGKALFVQDNRCSSCHPLGQQTTDGYAHDLGNHVSADQVRTFNTPTLRFVGLSAPYYHDGRYPTLDALLADPLTGMGTHADLDRADRAALAAFLQTL